MEFYDKLRAQYVKRWHIVHMDHQQSLADHLYNTAIIAGEIANQLGAEESDVNAIMIEALLHDVDEVRDGDMPTPAKNRKDGAVNVSDLSWTKLIIKTADILDAYWHITQHGRGVHAEQVRLEIETSTWEWVHSLPYPIGRVVEETMTRFWNGKREI